MTGFIASSHQKLKKKCLSSAGRTMDSIGLMETLVYRKASSTTSGLASMATLPAGLTVHPNPAAGTAALEWSNVAAGPIKLSISNLCGQTVYARSCAEGTSSLNLDVSAWPAGLYVVRLVSDNGFPDLFLKLVVTE